MIEYYSKSFPAKSYSSKIMGHEKSTFEKVLDMLFMMVEMTSGIKVLKKPLNLAIREIKTKVYVGVSTDKASIMQNAIISGSKVFDDSHDQENIIRKTADFELGFDVQSILKLNRQEFIDSYCWLLRTFDESDSLKERSEKIIEDNKSKKIPEQVNETVKSIVNGLNQQGSNIGGNGMWIHPIFKARELVIDSSMCFCILPFNKKRLELFDEVIKPNLENNYNLTVIRSGKVYGPNLDIRENIWTYINKASFVIADLSDYNANVYYELGICHTLGKKVITLCDEESFNNDYDKNLPFDISTINTIFYKNKLSGPTKLVEEIDKNVTAIRQGKEYVD